MGLVSKCTRLPARRARPSHKAEWGLRLKGGRKGGGLGRLVFSQDYLGRKTRFSSTVTNYVTKLDSLGIDEEPLHLPRRRRRSAPAGHIHSGLLLTLHSAGLVEYAS